MKRHLKVAAKIIDEDYCSITVLEQSHTEEEFGIERVEGRESAFCHGDVALVSGAFPDYYYDETGFCSLKGANHALYVRGREQSLDSYNIPYVPIKLWPEIKAAVKAYNEYFK